MDREPDRLGAVESGRHLRQSQPFRGITGNGFAAGGSMGGFDLAIAEKALSPDVPAGMGSRIAGGGSVLVGRLDPVAIADGSGFGVRRAGGHDSIVVRFAMG